LARRRHNLGIGLRNMPRFEHPIEYPFAAEAAAALGYAGRKLRKTLDALRDFDGDRASSRKLSLRADLVANAAEAFWSYVVQREEFGLLDPEYIREQYQVPEDVWRAMGPKLKP
jgi:hypothetical protein